MSKLITIPYEEYLELEKYKKTIEKFKEKTASTETWEFSRSMHGSNYIRIYNAKELVDNICSLINHPQVDKDEMRKVRSIEIVG